MTMDARTQARNQARRKARATAQFESHLEDARRCARRAAAERAVAKTGLAWWRSGYDDPQKGEEFDAACAALAALEAK